VLFLLDAGQPSRRASASSCIEKLIGKSRDKIIFVITKRDIWSDDEREEALAYVRTRARQARQEPRSSSPSPPSAPSRASRR
jgi:hypothetical protein